MSKGFKRFRACYCFRVDGNTRCEVDKRKAARLRKKLARSGERPTKITRHEGEKCMWYGHTQRIKGRSSRWGYRY